MNKVCPDCGSVISWNSHFKAYQHPSSNDCVYEENENGERVWDNKMRDEQLKNGTYPKRIRVLEKEREL